MYNPFETILQELVQIKEAIATIQTSSAPTIEIIDRPELLKRLAITEPTAIRWGQKGKIPEIRIGSNIRYNWPEVVASLEKQSK